MTDETSIPSLPIVPTSPLERVQVARLKHLGNVFLISQETGMSVAEVNQHLAQIQEAEHRDPNQFVASNMAMYIISGCEMRSASMVRQLAAIDGRHQMWRSVCCHAPVEEVPATPGIPATTTAPEVLPTPAFKRCLVCRLGCNVMLIDYPTICRVRLETLNSLREEVKLELHALEKLRIIGEKQPQYVQNVKQNILVVGGKEQDYLKLGPMEMDRLLGDLKKSLVGMDEEIKKVDEEIAREEAELMKEEAKSGQQPAVDIGGTQAPPSGTQTGQGEETPRTTEEKVGDSPSL